jgi:hypothetical protein
MGQEAERDVTRPWFVYIFVTQPDSMISIPNSVHLEIMQITVAGGLTNIIVFGRDRHSEGKK